jgi:hypothetical protein
LTLLLASLFWLLRFTLTRPYKVMDEYEATFKVVVRKSPLREGWYGQLVVSEDQTVDMQLTGQGPTALDAARNTIGTFAQASAYTNAILEAALLRGTREKRRELPGKKR